MIRWIVMAACAVVMAGCAANRPPLAAGTSGRIADQSARGRVVRHVVLFDFKEGASEDEVRRVVEAFRGLPERIPRVRGFEWGKNVSPEGLAHGYTHGFTVSFANAADRDAYLVHPAHQRLVEMLGPVLEKALVFDYVAGD